MRCLRVYADTSVFGGCFDPEFRVASEAFFRQVQAGRFALVIAAVVLRELDSAPGHVQEMLAQLPKENVETIELSEEVRRLRDAYVEMRVVGPASVDDAEHVASASVAGVDLFLSWNFKHIVRFDKITGFQAVNMLCGYRPIAIHSPREVVEI